MAGFFNHIGGATVGTTPLPETTFSGILDSIVSDIGAGVNGWTLYDDQRVSGTGNFIIANGNVGGIDSGGSAGEAAWTSGSSTPPSNTNWQASAGNQAQTEFYPGRSLISFDKTNWYQVTNIPALTGASNQFWTFTLNTNYSGTTFTNQQYYVKLQHYIVLQCSSSQKTFYVLLAKPDSTCNILRVQAFETWSTSSHTGTVPSNQEIIRGSDSPETIFWNNNWDNQPVKYMLWLLPHAMGIWAGWGSGPTSRTPMYDFAYIGNLDLTGLPTSGTDTNALVFGCSNQQLSGFGINFSQNIATGYAANSMGGLMGGMRCLRTLNSESWAPPISSTSRPNGWHPANQYAPYPRGMSYMQRLDATGPDIGGRVQFTELDVYQMGGGSTSTTGTNYTPGSGTGYTEGKRGMMRYVRVPVNNPSGLHLSTVGPGDDGNTYIMFRTFYGQATSASGNSYTFYDGGNEAKLTAFAWGRKATTTNPSDIQTGSASSIRWIRWFMMPTNL